MDSAHAVPPGAVRQWHVLGGLAGDLGRPGSSGRGSELEEVASLPSPHPSVLTHPCEIELSCQPPGCTSHPTAGKPRFCTLPCFSVVPDPSLSSVLEKLLWSVCPICPRMGGSADKTCMARATAARPHGACCSWGTFMFQGTGFPTSSPVRAGPPGVSDVGPLYTICLKKGSYHSKENV